MIQYTDPALVTDIKVTTNYRAKGNTVSGYGGALPSNYMIRYAGRWQRVLVMSYGNSGSAYIRKGGNNLHLDTDTEYDCMAVRDEA